MTNGLLHPIDQLAFTTRYLAAAPAPPRPAAGFQEEAHAQLGEVYLRRRQRRRARHHLSLALLYQPDCARYHHLLATTLTATDPAKAREHFSRSLTLAPDVPACLADFGLFRLRIGQAEQGLTLLRRAASLTADNLTILAKVCRGLCKAGAYAEARRLLREARQRRPRDRRLRRLCQRVLTCWLYARQKKARAAAQRRREDDREPLAA